MTMLPRLQAASLLGLLALAGCGGDDLTRTFGLTRDAPDEFTVTTRAPLSMPPTYDLKPPTPGASRPQELLQRQQAEAVLVPEVALNGSATAASSPGQQALMAAAGPGVAGDIRNRVDAESALDSGSRSFTDRLMFWRTPTAPGTVVDAQRESQRLRQNAALGQSAQGGDTPIIQRKRTGLFSSIF